MAPKISAATRRLAGGRVPGVLSAGLRDHGLAKPARPPAAAPTHPHADPEANRVPAHNLLRAKWSDAVMPHPYTSTQGDREKWHWPYPRTLSKSNKLQNSWKTKLMHPAAELQAGIGCSSGTTSARTWVTATQSHSRQRWSSKALLCCTWRTIALQWRTWTRP